MLSTFNFFFLFFLPSFPILTTFYVTLVGVDGYCCNWWHSTTHTLDRTPLDKGSALRSGPSVISKSVFLFLSYIRSSLALNIQILLFCVIILCIFVADRQPSQETCCHFDGSCSHCHYNTATGCTAFLRIYREIISLTDRQMANVVCLKKPAGFNKFYHTTSVCLYRTSNCVTEF
jgi:hypothetical protein